MTPRLLVSLVSIALAACTSPAVPVESAAPDASETSGDASTGAAPDEVIPLQQACSGPEDPYDVETIEVEGDLLHVTLNYGGGCEAHTYQACWSGALAKSLPPQASLELRHDGHSDACEASITETVTIDLSSLRDAAGGAVVVRLGEQSVRLPE